MSHLTRMQDVLPPPYTVEPDSVVSSVLNAIALELEAFQEDLDRYQRTHWIRSVYRLADAERMAALTGIKRLPWEDLDLFRERLLALVIAFASGATGPGQIRHLVYDYLSQSERVVGATFVPGLAKLHTAEAAYAQPTDQPRYRPLALVENPLVQRRSGILESIGGQVPYLYRWTDINHGLDHSVAKFVITGVRAQTAVPVLVNLTTGDLLGYAGALRFGQVLHIGLSGAGGATTARTALATLNGADVTGKLFSLASFQPGVPFGKDRLDPTPRLPRMVRGPNEWLFLALGLYDVPGLDHFYFAIADDLLREGVFDKTTFDHAVFPAGARAKLEMSWIETEPASFQIRVPRYVVLEPAGVESAPVWAHLEEGLRDAIGQLHAAGVRSSVHFDPFVEVQDQTMTFRLPLKVFDPEVGPSGVGDELSFGSRFGESPLGSSRFN